MINCINKKCDQWLSREPHNCAYWNPHHACGFIPEVEAKKMDSTFVTSLIAEYDMVNQPKHYEMFPEFDLEVKDVIQVAIKKNILDPVQAAWYKDVLKYLLRCGTKDAYLQDLRKSKMYLEWLIKEVEANVPLD